MRVATRQRMRDYAAARMPPPPAAATAAAGAVVPYDAAATFRITGEPGNLLQDVINIGSDGTFVAVAIGYGFQEERERPMYAPDRRPAAPVNFDTLTLGQLPVIALIDGFRVNPAFGQWVFGGAAAPAAAGLPADQFYRDVLQRIKTPAELAFLFSFVDGGSGREFQDQAVHSLASLGSASGERPFRMLPHPCSFAPRTTLRLQVTERTAGVRGTLFVVLFGYRLLGLASCPEPLARQVQAPYLAPAAGNAVDSQFIPYDHVARLDLTGRRGNHLETELAVSADVAFMATHVGYGLTPDSSDVTFEDGLPEGWLAPNGKGDLAKLPLRAFPPDALLDGIRIRPGWIRLALKDSGDLASDVAPEILERIFERLNRPEDVSFRYAFSDAGTARDMQNQRLYNVAGLGSADGDRPFKKLARPMAFLPRSTIRVEVEEHFGRGRLYIVFQGYKALGRAQGRA